MMKSVIVIGKCVNVKTQQKNSSSFVIKFRGIYKGSFINQIIVKTNGKYFCIEEGNNYVLHIKFESVVENKLIGNLIKARDF